MIEDSCNIILLGEHDKGTGAPFHHSTLSGRRLRALVAEIELDCKFDNAFLWDGYARKAKDIGYLSGTVIALGRVAEDECHRQGVKCYYLPHPACRSKDQLMRLREGLLHIKRMYHQKILE